jgi:hypothetical protein
VISLSKKIKRSDMEKKIHTPVGINKTDAK